MVIPRQFAKPYAGEVRLAIFARFQGDAKKEEETGASLPHPLRLHWANARFQGRLPLAFDFVYKSESADAERNGDLRDSHLSSFCCA